MTEHQTMPVREAARLALNQIRSQKLKSFFAVIGVIIGVMFLMTVVSVVEGMNVYMEEDFARAIYGINTVTLRRTPSVQIDPSPDMRRELARRPRIDFEDADAVREALSVPATVGVFSMGQGTLTSEDGVEVENVLLAAGSAEAFKIRNYEVVAGRAFTAPEDRLGTPVVVLGAEAAAQLFGRLTPLGRTVKIQNLPFRVIGVLEEQGTLFGFSLDNMAIAPSRSVMARFVAPHGVVDEVLVQTESPADMDQAALDIEAIMRVRRHLRPSDPNDFAIETAEESMSFWTRISNILLIAFPGLVSIALVVGGMVIMNIMLVSVVERTREIGIRKAVGARRRDIQAQVLIEATILSAAGAAIGVGIGIGLAQIVRAVSPLPAAIAPLWMGVSVTIAIGVGVVAGLYPAVRAARMDPVVALRAE